MLHVRTTLGPLKCHVLQGDDAPPRLGVVLCHGYGAPGEDLVPIGSELLGTVPALAQGVRFVFPEAPHALAQLGGVGARAWWEIDLERRMALMNQGEEGRALRDEIPEGLTSARRSFKAFLEAFLSASGLPQGRVVLGGFSQGAMLTTDVALSLDEAPAALCIWSGTLINQKDWVAKASRRAGLRVFQSHGTLDPILRYADAEALRDLLLHAQLQVEFLSFQGAHTIPLEGLERTGRLLSSLL